MGFLDNVKDALKDAVSTQTSKDAAAKKDDVVVDRADTTSADDSAPPAPPTIPVDTDTDSADTEPTTEATTGPVQPAEARFETYTVKSGDTLSEIGARFGVSYQEIAKLNSIENPDLIFPGQVFRIPKN